MRGLMNTGEPVGNEVLTCDLRPRKDSDLV